MRARAEPAAFAVGDAVDKKQGYRFPGTVQAVFFNQAGELRYVVELDGYGLLHIFSEQNLVVRKRYRRAKRGSQRYG